jgi:hypothetical protein
MKATDMTVILAARRHLVTMRQPAAFHRRSSLARVAARCILLYHPKVDYSALVRDAAFAVREGLRVVGHGRVLRRLEG